MFSSFKKGLRSIDFYQAVPSEYSEGTVSGACISVVSVALLVFLCIMSVINFSEPKIDSDLIIDQKHLAEKLKVHIDIEFPRYPCSFLSLDVENILKVHLVNVMDNLKKTVVPDGHIYDDSRLNDDQKVEQVIRDINEKKGCRMTGFFEIDRVPGNFHFSCHGYGSIIHRLVNQGYRMLDMTHHIYYLRFGEEESTEYGSNSLKDFNSEKEIEEVFMGITYTYFLDIIEKNTIDVNNEKGKESYIYTARLNEVILAQLPMVYFKYSLYYEDTKLTL